MKKRILSLFLAALMVGGLFPLSAQAVAQPPHKYRFTANTSNDTSSGTDANLTYTPYYGGKPGTGFRVPTDGDPYEKGHWDTAYGYETKEGSAPWLMDRLDIYNDNSGFGSDWTFNLFEVSSRAIDDVEAYIHLMTTGKEELKGGRTRIYTITPPKRDIHSTMGFATWSGSKYINSLSNGKITATWDRRVIDNYCSQNSTIGYNPFLYPDTPNLTVRSSNSAISVPIIQNLDNPEAPISFSIDEATLNQQMQAANLGQVTFTFTLSPSSGRTIFSKGCETQTLTIYRRCFTLGKQSISTPYFADTDRYYFNQANREVAITLEPTSIHLNPEMTAAQKSMLVENFSCRAELYSAKVPNQLITAMVLKKDPASGKLIFTGTVPSAYSSGGYGVILKLTNVQSKYSADGGPLSVYTLNSGTSIDYAFSTHKVDTQSPTITLLDKASKPLSIQNKLAASHIFYPISSEVLYPKADSKYPRKFSYALYAANAAGTDYAATPTRITNYDGSGSATEVAAPINTTVLTDAPITLKLSDKTEGKFRLRLFAFDEAANGLLANVSADKSYFDIDNVLLDNQAPRVKLTDSYDTVAQADGSKRAKFSFDLEDISATDASNDTWARVYYCFVKKGGVMPAFSPTGATGGEIGSTLGKWAFIQGGKNAGTALFTVGTNSSFEGTLYYLTEDSQSNRSSVYSKLFQMNNSSVRNTLMGEVTSTPKSSFNMFFADDADIKTEYRWVALEPGNTFRQDFRPYSSGTPVGSARQIDATGKEVLMNGRYNLEYTCTHTGSSNYRTFTQEYTFDNQAPVQLPVWQNTANLLALPNQQLTLNIQDKSGIKSAVYRIVNPDGSDIKGQSDTALILSPGPDNLAAVSQSLTFALPESGVYALRVAAYDNNGFSVVTAPQDIGLFALRTQRPTVTTLTSDITGRMGDTPLTNQAKYALNVTVAEPMRNQASLGTEQGIKYAVSTDGMNYGAWTAADARVTPGENQLSYQFSIDTPAHLREGKNTIYLKVACVNRGDAGEVLSTLTSEAKQIAIHYDATPPTFEPIVYSQTTLTNQSVTGKLVAADAGTGTTTLTCASNLVEISSVHNDGTYALTVRDCVDTTAVLEDLAGNRTLVPVKVTNIDKAPPEITAEVEPFISGTRKDAKLTVTVRDRTATTVQFALADGSDVALTPEAYSSFQSAGFDVRSTTPTLNSEGVYETVYTILARCLEGSYKLGVKAVDSLRQETEKLFPQTFDLTITPAEIASVVCSPERTSSATIATITFNAKVAVQKNGVFQDSYSETYTTVLTSAEPFTLTVRDEGGDIQDLQVTPEVEFTEEVSIQQELLRNGDPIENSTPIALGPEDTLRLFITPVQADGMQFFPGTETESGDVVPNGLELVGFELNNELSERAGISYSKFCFDAVRDGTAIKSAKFMSAVQGSGDAMQELAIVYTIDESAPECSYTFDSAQEPTNQPVFATLRVWDYESGISALDELIGDEYEAMTVQPATTLEFTESGTRTFRVTNGAGMSDTVSITVDNIDAAPIEEGTDYTVTYQYQNYLGEWAPITPGNAYRSVMAVLKPILSSSKTIRADNAAGMSKLLNATENSFAFQLRDLAGNTATQSVSYEHFDTTPGTTSWVLEHTDKTNQPVTATVTLADADSGIAFAEVTDRAGKVLPWKGEPLAGEYQVELPVSGIYTVTAYDGAGNRWDTDLTVSNIDTTLPKVTQLLYSIPAGTPTAKNVLVEVAGFSKPDVVITQLQLGEGMTEADIGYTPGSNVIRFKKSGNVSIELLDAYGNKNWEVINVGNIYSTPPQTVAVATLSPDKLSVNVRFALDTVNGVPKDLLRELSDLHVNFNGGNHRADNAVFTIKNNGTYRFTVFDSAGSTQQVELTVTDIDKRAPVIQQISWVYPYQEQVGESWTAKTEQRTIIVGTDTSGTEQGYTLGEANAPLTNADVTVIVTTDKDTVPVGSNGKPSTNAFMTYQKNGMYIFNQQAANGTTASYGVDVQVIDKTPPVIALKNSTELIFIEGMTADKDADYAYDKAKLLDYTAYDMRNGERHELTQRVKVDFGSFNPDDIRANTFDRNAPYYVTYTVYDDAGNKTELRRTIRLVGLYDTVALVNGRMPDSSGTISVADSALHISLKNFSGISYVRYEKNLYTMGQMKTRGTSLAERNGVYTLSGISEGWYTFFVQTDKRDYFTISVYYRPVQK